MEFKKIAQYVGVSLYPEKFDDAFKNLTKELTNFCDVFEIENIDKKYDVLGDYLELVLKGAKEVLNDKKLYLYGRTICEYIKSSTTVEARCVPLPEFDGTVGRDVFGILIMLTLIPQSICFYKSHGYCDEQIKMAFKSISSCTRTVENTTGIPRMTPLYYNWALLYVFGEIFNYDGFNYQFRKFYGGAIILKNKENGKYLPMMVENSFHKTGLVLGSAGADDKEGSFDAEFSENDKAFIGHLVYNGKVSPEKTICKKTEWECVLRPDEEVLAVHIPKKTNLSRDVFIRSFKGSFEKGKNLFPEHTPKFLVCYSWLLDPTLEDLLGLDSKIVGFGNAFLRFPIMSHGTEYKNFVFPGHDGPAETLPEDTSLQKKIKELLLSGGFIHNTAGVVTEL